MQNVSKIPLPMQKNNFMKNCCPILSFIIYSFFLFSCNNSSSVDNQKKIDSMFPQQNPSSNVSIKDSSSNENASEDKTEKPFHLSPKDSARVADSVYHSKNGIRDFN